MSVNSVKDMAPASTIGGVLAGSAISPFASVLGGVVGRTKEKQKRAAKGLADDYEGYAAGTVDDYAASGDSLASGGSLSLLASRRRSAGTIEAPTSVQPRIDQLTNLFSARKSQIQQRQSMPGLRASTVGKMLT